MALSLTNRSGCIPSIRGRQRQNGGFSRPPLIHVHLQMAAFSPYSCRGGDGSMLISRRELGCMFPAALAVWPRGAAAQSPNVVGQIANYSGGDRQAMMEAGAKA